jgi:hypothetical protein
MNGKAATLLVLALCMAPCFAGKPDSTSSGATFVAFQQDQTASATGVSIPTANPSIGRTVSQQQSDAQDGVTATNGVEQKKIHISGFDRFLDMWR